ncbi:hypothetical protein [Methanobrevibacter sp. UBA313]|jgi:uncharacterized membrane protein (UPF0182 family)|uniref:hypothetical protein n=1 Tax=Methanobrevibacter sp. UBA313 TaxID=1915477 RepID=UPI0039B84EAE
MSIQLFVEGAILGITTTIPLKYGVSLDPVDYGILLLRTIDLLPRNSNSIFNIDGDINFFINFLIVLTVIGVIITIVDIYRKIQDDPTTRLPVFGIGFLFGLILILMA